MGGLSQSVATALGVQAEELKRRFTAEQRRNAADSGAALPDESFPIYNQVDLDNAVRLVGQAKDPDKAKAHIRERAADLGLDLPDSWKDGEPDDVEVKWESTGVIEHKAVPVSGFKVLDADAGIVECMVSVTGLLDRVKDIIEPGAYAKTLAQRTPKGVWSHQWDAPISKTIAVEELLPGDPGLPVTTKAGDPWPREAGALRVRTQFNLDGERGRQAYSDVKFFGDEQEWSIGYNVPSDGAVVERKTGIRRIKQLDLFEYSPVLFGAMPEAVTTSVKSAQEAYRALDGDETKRAMTDAERAAAIAAAKPTPKPGPTPAGGHAPGAGVRSANAVAGGTGGPKVSATASPQAGRQGGGGGLDAHGHAHVPSGPTGGQFAPKGGGNSALSNPAAPKPVVATPAKPKGKGKGGHKAKGGGKSTAHTHKGARGALPLTHAHSHTGAHTHPVTKGPGGTIKVTAGMTLWDLAGKYLGDPTRWREIAVLNGVKDPKQLPIGAVLKLPGSTVAGHKSAPDVETKVDAPVYDDNGPIWDQETMAQTGDTLDEDQDDTRDDDDDAREDEDEAHEQINESDLSALHDDPGVLMDAEQGVLPHLQEHEFVGAKWALTEDDPEFKSEIDPNESEIKAGNAETLRRYWAEGEGAAKIRWGEGGDWQRCVDQVSKYMPGRAEGYCNLLHHRAMGVWPAQHAEMMGKSVPTLEEFGMKSAYLACPKCHSTDAKMDDGKAVCADCGAKLAARFGAKACPSCESTDLTQVAVEIDGQTKAIDSCTECGPIEAVWELKDVYTASVPGLSGNGPSAGGYTLRPKIVARNQPREYCPNCKGELAPGGYCPNCKVTMKASPTGDDPDSDEVAAGHAAQLLRSLAEKLEQGVDPDTSAIQAVISALNDVMDAEDEEPDETKTKAETESEEPETKTEEAEPENKGVDITGDLMQAAAFAFKATPHLENAG